MFKPVPSVEIYRKLLHGLVVFFPVGVFYGPTYFHVCPRIIAAFCLGVLLLSFAIELFRFRSKIFGSWYFSTFGSLLREEERFQLTGATFVASSIFLCSFLSLQSERMAASAFLCMSLFVLGDAAAALTGKSMGRFAIGQKTLEGGLGCFGVCLVLSYLVFPILPGFLAKWGGGLSFGQCAVLALLVSVMELFPIKIRGYQMNDNLYVPVVATLFAYFALLP